MVSRLITQRKRGDKAVTFFFKLKIGNLLDCFVDQRRAFKVLVKVLLVTIHRVLTASEVTLVAEPLEKK